MTSKDLCCAGRFHPTIKSAYDAINKERDVYIAIYGENANGQPKYKAYSMCTKPKNTKNDSDSDFCHIHLKQSIQNAKGLILSKDFCTNKKYEQINADSDYFDKYKQRQLKKENKNIISDKYMKKLNSIFKSSLKKDFKKKIEKYVLLIENELKQNEPCYLNTNDDDDESFEKNVKKINSNLMKRKSKNKSEEESEEEPEEETEDKSEEEPEDKFEEEPEEELEEELEEEPEENKFEEEPNEEPDEEREELIVCKKYKQKERVGEKYYLEPSSKKMYDKDNKYVGSYFKTKSKQSPFANGFTIVNDEFLSDGEQYNICFISKNVYDIKSGKQIGYVKKNGEFIILKSQKSKGNQKSKGGPKRMPKRKT
jgi:hypothetical protein